MRSKRDLNRMCSAFVKHVSDRTSSLREKRASVARHVVSSSRPLVVLISSRSWYYALMLRRRATTRKVPLARQVPLRLSPANLGAPIECGQKPYPSSTQARQRLLGPPC